MCAVVKKRVMGKSAVENKYAWREILYLVSKKIWFPDRSWQFCAIGTRLIIGE